MTPRTLKQRYHCVLSTLHSLRQDARCIALDLPTWGTESIEELQHYIRIFAQKAEDLREAINQKEREITK